LYLPAKAPRASWHLPARFNGEPGDISAVELVRRLLGTNAMIHTALASEKPEEISHA
jgi:hypothetical protein